MQNVQSYRLADPSAGSDEQELGGSPAQLHWIDRELGWALIAAVVIGIAVALTVRSK